MVEQHSAVEHVVVVFFGFDGGVVVHFAAGLLHILRRVPKTMVVPEMQPVAKVTI